MKNIIFNILLVLLLIGSVFISNSRSTAQAKAIWLLVSFNIIIVVALNIISTYKKDTWGLFFEGCFFSFFIGTLIISSIILLGGLDYIRRLDTASTSDTFYVVAYVVVYILTEVPPLIGGFRFIWNQDPPQSILPDNYKNSGDDWP